MPPLLAGRTAELRRAERGLDDLDAGIAPSRSLLLYGPRGNGKTILAQEIVRQAEDRRFRTGVLPAAEFRDSASIASRLRRLGESQRTGVQAGPFGASFEPGSLSDDLAHLLQSWVGREPAPLVMFLDEVHILPADAARSFFGAIQHVGRESLPFWLIAAGTPDAPRRIRRAGTFNERQFAEVPIGRISRAETLRALEEPAAAAGRPMESRAAAQLAEWSRDYPFFIQLLGEAAWEAAGRDGLATITTHAAAAARRTAEPEQRRFYKRRYDEAVDRGLSGVLRPLAEAIARNGGAMSEVALVDLLESITRDGLVAMDAVSLRNTLTDLGILWERDVWVWEMGIPSLADFLLEGAPTGN